MGPCCVEGCEITSEQTFYFEFPASRPLRRKWLELIPIPGKLPLGTVVCSRHFSPDDYESVRGKVRLKSKVVPRLHLLQKQTPPSEIPLPSPLRPTKALSPPKSPPPAKAASPPKSPPSKVLEADGDSTTVSVPSPIDAEKMIDDIQRRLAGSIHKLVKTQNGVSWDVGTSSPFTPMATLTPVANPLDQKEDIEEMITNYHIKNKVPNPALRAELVPLVPLAGSGAAVRTVPVEFEVPLHDTIEIDDVNEAAPVFIEVPVDKDVSTAGAGSQDCLMVLESVQVEVDPSSLLLVHDPEYYREEEWKASKKEDPISLLTSSDEDDVILQEPHIDTVEVSDETDEDDQPLVKLVKKKPETSKKKLLKKKAKIKKRPKQNIEKIVWGMYDFFCVQCHFSTKSAKEYNDHLSGHSTVLHVCQICSYTSSSRTMFAKHTRIHKTEKKFKCRLCDYRARHKMSLVYHLKTHDSDISSLKGFRYPRCGFKSEDKIKILKHLSSCKECEKKHVCEKCDYKTKKKSDLKRHCSRIHPDDYSAKDTET